MQESQIKVWNGNIQNNAGVRVVLSDSQGVLGVVNSRYAGVLAELLIAQRHDGIHLNCAPRRDKTANQRSQE